ncbi:solute:sodium symporter family transporter [Aquiflexum sp. LQ15W]|uniref:solute:sodium symporter family transporter n=1 Tax=Cognataquiflexum nitidum TaxID=2922272 RepID=UPI001F13E38F|nr:solute:sodium symporter family transporter [Cognataquiflexum nitidum]MCH6198914.1 solute:sodium symporter family transporter [Cognataquiflexum nitidum]
MTLTVVSFIAFTLFVAFYSWYKTRNQNLKTSDGYFLGGKSLTGVVIAGSMIMTNISTDHLVGMNGSSYVNGFIIVAWEVTSSLALILAAVYFVPRYLKMGLSTIPEYLERRFDATIRSMVAFFLLVSFAITLLPIVLYTGAINLESLFDVAATLGVSYDQGIWITVVTVGILGSIYAVLGGLKAVAISDTINGYGLFIAGALVPVMALILIGDGNPVQGFFKVYNHRPEKFNVIGKSDSVLPFETLFTGLIINQIYFWCMNQTIIQRALGAKNLIEAQKGLLLTGVLKLIVPFIIVLPGVIGYYYFGESLFEEQDQVYPALVKKVLPVGFTGLFAAIVLGAVLSTFNSVLNSASTIFSLDIYKKIINPRVSDINLVRVGKASASILAVSSILIAPMISRAPEGVFQLLQELNGIFFIPIASIMLAGFLTKNITALSAKVALITGLVFYITTVFILKVDIHFVHIWGIEFLINVGVMFLISYARPQRIVDRPILMVTPVDLRSWKFTPIVSLFLVLIPVGIYIFYSLK